MVKNLKLLRYTRCISQQQLADVIGVSQQSVNKYENHKVEPDIRTLSAIADYFGTSLDFLVGRTDINSMVEPIQTYDLNDDEADLVKGYRKLSANEKQSLHMIIENYNHKRI